MADIGYGTDLQLNSTVIGNVFNVDGPDLSRDDVEVTVYASASGYREYIPGLKEGGEISLMMNLLSTQATLQELFHSTAAQTTAGVSGTTNAVSGSFMSDTLQTFRLVGPNTDYWDMSGYVKGITQAQPIDDRRTWSVTIKVSGAPTFGHGATT